MPIFLAIVGVVFVAFGVLAWSGLVVLNAPPPGARRPFGTNLPSAVQETPIFIAIGFGFVLIALGSLLSALRAAVVAIDQWRLTTEAAERRAMREEDQFVPPDLAAQAATLGLALVRKGPRYQAVGQGSTKYFDSADALRGRMASATVKSGQG